MYSAVLLGERLQKSDFEVKVRLAIRRGQGQLNGRRQVEGRLA